MLPCFLPRSAPLASAIFLFHCFIESDSWESKNMSSTSPPPTHQEEECLVSGGRCRCRFGLTHEVDSQMGFLPWIPADDGCPVYRPRCGVTMFGCEVEGTSRTQHLTLTLSPPIPRQTPHSTKGYVPCHSKPQVCTSRTNTRFPNQPHPLSSEVCVNQTKTTTTMSLTDSPPSSAQQRNPSSMDLHG
ncbi:hypothetical protein VTI74DRAFT_789 [Chaetomium olivicolor]